MKLIQEAVGSKLVRTPKGPQMHPKFDAGLKLLEGANEIWDRIEKELVASPPPPARDSLEAFRRKKHKWDGLL